MEMAMRVGLKVSVKSVVRASSCVNVTVIVTAAVAVFTVVVVVVVIVAAAAAAIVPLLL